MKRKRRRGRRELEKRVEYLRKEKDGNHEKFYTLLFFDFFFKFFFKFFPIFLFFFLIAYVILTLSGFVSVSLVAH